MENPISVNPGAAGGNSRRDPAPGTPRRPAEGGPGAAKPEAVGAGSSERAAAAGSRDPEVGEHHRNATDAQPFETVPAADDGPHPGPLSAEAATARDETLLPTERSGGPRPTRQIMMRVGGAFMVIVLPDRDALAPDRPIVWAIKGLGDPDHPVDAGSGG
ncbi:MAG: hypothetical protein M0Z53_04580 [Thermaerobacter sp.]|nr:hypothetical protein [Thermaerobacter sp.]